MVSRNSASPSQPPSEHVALAQTAQVMFLGYLGAQHLVPAALSASPAGAAAMAAAAVRSAELVWQQRASKNCINVMTSPVAGSVWQVIRATTYVRSRKAAVCELLTDDDRMADYDENVDFVQVDAAACQRLDVLCTRERMLCCRYISASEVGIECHFAGGHEGLVFVCWFPGVFVVMFGSEYWCSCIVNLMLIYLLTNHALFPL